MKWLVSVGFMMFMLPGLAADIYVEKNHQIHIDGEIRNGDSERVASLISRMPAVSSFKVKSLGGNIDESLRISALIEGTSASFIIKKGEICASACFFMYISSISRFANAFHGEEGQTPRTDGRYKIFSYVGIHRPYLASKDEVNAASANKQEVLMQAVREYLRKKQVPQYLVDEMMGRASNQVYWLREKDIDLLGDFSPGYEEILIKECGYNKTARINSWTENRQDEFNNCSFDVWQREYYPSQARYIKRLATGWRPWGKR